MARVSGWAGAAVLAACVALTVTAPSSAAGEARASAGPNGVQAKAAAIAVASTGRVLPEAASKCKYCGSEQPAAA